MTATTTRAAETWAHILAAPDGRTLWMAAADYAREEHDGTPEEVAAHAAAVEAVAQQHLDAHPEDHRARRLLGEWLQWHGDVRGEGYRALGVCGRVPLDEPPTAYSSLDRQPIECSQQTYSWFNPLRWETRVDDGSGLPATWLAASEGGERGLHFMDSVAFDTRRAAEDAAALAFARLPAERRAQLLKGEM